MKNEILNIINQQIVPSKNDCLWRYAPEFAASKIEELFKQWHIAVVMQALPLETITKEAVKYDASFGLTYLSTRELQIKAFKDGASFALQSISKAAVASAGQGEANTCAGFCECTEPRGDINQFGCMNCQKQIRG
jgi:beta-lactamase class A